MSSENSHQGGCPAPFLDESTFPSRGGHIESRLCTVAGPGLRCCLPCPSTDWVYTQGLKKYFTIAGTISAVGLVLTLFILLSWAVLPPEKTKRHAFGLSLSSGIVCICLAIMVGAAVNPQQCFNEITPNDLHSSLACAFTGVFVICGAVIVTTWAWIRAVVMHLQVCWNITPSRYFTYGTQIVGWSITITLIVLNLIVTGVSYRFGPTCHINAHRSLIHYWGPLFILSGTAMILAIVTMLYCMYVYIKHFVMEQPTEQSDSTDLRSSVLGPTSTRALYRRIRKALWLNWRSLVIIGFVLLDVAFYSAVYVKLDHIILAATDGTPEGLARVLPYIVCLVEHSGDRTQCFDEAGKVLVTQNTALAVLMLLSFAGIQCFALLVRAGVFTGWRDLIKGMLTSSNGHWAGPPAQFARHQSRTQLSDPESVGIQYAVKYPFHDPTQYSKSPSSDFSRQSPITAADTADHYMPGSVNHQRDQVTVSYSLPFTALQSSRYERPMDDPTSFIKSPSTPSIDSAAEFGEAMTMTVTRISQDTIQRSPLGSPGPRASSAAGYSRGGS